MVDKTRIGIYGIGNFGYAWLKHFDMKKGEGIHVRAFDINPEVIRSLKETRKHPFLHTHVEISDRIEFATSPEELMQDIDVLLLAVTSEATREVIQNVKPYLRSNTCIVNTAKALDVETGKRLSEIIAEELDGFEYTYALLSGGTIAQDLFAHEPLGIDIASTNTNILPGLVKLFESKNLSVYPTTDLAGVEYAGAFKNVIAILAGMIHGMGFSYGSETHIISRAAGEIQHVVTEHLGGKPETFSISSQSWGNDLWMSCTGGSRNREFGVLLGTGMSVDAALKEMQQQHKNVEGIKTIAALTHVPEIHRYPLLQFLHTSIEKRAASLDELRTLIFSHSF